MPHVDVLIDGGRHIGGREQPALLAHLERHRARADAVENLPRHRVRHHAVGRSLENERGGVRRGEPVLSQLRRKLAIKRHIDQHLRHHHEEGR